MSKIDSLDSDNKVFSEIWNAVKQDKFGDGSDSDQAVFNTLNQSLSLESGTNSLLTRMKAIPEDSSMSSKDSFALPENPVPSPIYYPAATGIPDGDGDVTGPDSTAASKAQADASDKSILALRECCSSRQQKCSCDVMPYFFKYFQFFITRIFFFLEILHNFYF